MNEVMQIRMSSWTAMVKERKESGMSIKEWCAANGIRESVYYYRLNRLRKAALAVYDTPKSKERGECLSGTFAQIPIPSSSSASGITLRIRRGDILMEVSDDASDRILSFLKEVLDHAV